MISLAEQVAVVTGGSRGIGAATVKLFAAAGAHVVFPLLCFCQVRASART